MKKTVQYLIICIFLLFPLFSEACAMCQAGATEEYINAYKMTTALLILLPLITGTIIFIWIYKKK